mgnify:CR=1 FL=1
MLSVIKKYRKKLFVAAVIVAISITLFVYGKKSKVTEKNVPEAPVELHVPANTSSAPTLPTADEIQKSQEDNIVLENERICMDFIDESDFSWQKDQLVADEPWCVFSLANTDLTGVTCEQLDPDSGHTYAGWCNKSCKFGLCKTA